MKKIISVILCFVTLFSSTMSIMATEQTEQYWTINAEFSDNIGNIEQINVMIKDNQVYGNAVELANRLGYQINDTNNEYVVVYNKQNKELPYGMTLFYYNDTKVNHMLFTKMVDSYEAPYSSIRNDKGIWIPLEYSLLILNSGLAIVEDTVLIDIPEKSIIDLTWDVMKDFDQYTFGWEKDFGYTELDWELIGWSSHCVNLLNGILKFDGDSWAQLFQHFAMNSSSYDKRYGEDFSMLFCTQSDKELEEIVKNVQLLQDLLIKDGKIGSMLSEYSTYLDGHVEAMYATCENILKDMKNGNSSMGIYNRSYQALEDAIDKQTWFSKTGGKILEVQTGVSSAIPYVDIGLKIAEIAKYGEEFMNQDKFSVQSLSYFLENTSEQTIASNEMKYSMNEYLNKLQGNLKNYSAKRFFDENVDDWVTDALNIREMLGKKATIALIAWDLSSNYIPFISNGISAADKFELALYSSIFQTDAFINYRNCRDQLFMNENNITAKNLYDLSQYCYVYLKACYITRDAALGSLEGKREDTKEKIQPLIDYQNKINSDIAVILVKLKSAKETNEKLLYGFLPDDSKKYLTEYDDSKLIELCSFPFRSNTLNELELLAITESNAGHTMDDYVYTDMDHDGLNELIGVYCDNMGLFQTWYCSSDGKTCVLVHQNDDGMDACEIELLDIGNETHVVLNAYRMMGTGKNHSIIALKNQKIVCYISNKYGYVSMVDNGDITLNVEAYDGVYDPDIGETISHTWKDTYLFFDGNAYKEYGATEIIEEDYLGYQNAQEIKDMIDDELRQSNTTFLEYKYFKRKNGIMHIQCNVYGDSGEIQYGYYTVGYNDNILDKNLGEYISGQMTPSFSDLEVVY